MLTITTKKGNMFKDLQEDVVYLHACNCQGHWGAGIAVEFKRHFPLAYEKHRKAGLKPGTSQLLSDNGHYVACLMTSRYYGAYKDKPALILEQTEKALESLLRGWTKARIEIHSPKINSGYFGVKWEDTLKVIEKVASERAIDVDWTVWVL